MRKRKNYTAGNKTAVKKTAKKRGTNKEDPFLRLPEELLLFILDKLHDLKYLCQCSVVSKHFASVISRIQTVSLTVPSSGALSNESIQNLHTLLRKAHLPSSEKVPAILDFLSHQNLKLPTFLEKLQHVKSVHLEYLHPKNGGNLNLPSLKWKVEFNDSGEVENYAALLSLSTQSKEAGYDHPNEQSLQVPTELIDTQISNGFLLPYLRHVEWMCLTYVLVKYSSLTSVTITDSEKQSKLVMREKDLLKMRSNGPVLKQVRTGNIVKIARVPILHLPLSGYVMRCASLLLVTADEDTNEHEMIFSNFEEDDDKVLGEAIKEILKNHGGRILTIRKIYTENR